MDWKIICIEGHPDEHTRGNSQTNCAGAENKSSVTMFPSWFSGRCDQCSYLFEYGDGSGTSSSYLYDTLYFDAILGELLIANSIALIVFGTRCSIYQIRNLTKTNTANDGIFGFGLGDLSVVSQLASREITPRVFSQCLKGQGNGGGILVLGEILEPSIVYNLLFPSKIIVYTRSINRYAMARMVGILIQ